MQLHLHGTEQGPAGMLTDLHSETECSFESGVLLLITQKALTSRLATLTSPLQSTHSGPGISGE